MKTKGWNGNIACDFIRLREKKTVLPNQLRDKHVTESNDRPVYSITTKCDRKDITTFLLHGMVSNDAINTQTSDGH